MTCSRYHWASVALGLLGSLGIARAASCSGTTTITCTGGPAASMSTTSGSYTAASTYPATITIPGTFGGTVTTVSLTLHKITATDATTQSDSNINELENVAILLVSPDGRNMEILRNVGLSGNQINSPGLTLTISDSASNLMPDPLGPSDWPSCPDATPCQYKPTVTYNDFQAPTTYPSNNPVAHASHEGSCSANDQTNGVCPPSSTTLNTVFSGAAAAGDWKLYLVGYSFGGNTYTVGFLSWDLTLTVALNAASTTTSLSSSVNPSFTSGTSSSTALTATVTSGSGTPTGTVNFTDSITGSAVTISGCGSVALSGGTATCSTSFASEGIHPLNAVYTPGSGSFSTSSTTSPVNQWVKKHSTIVNGNYCNTGPISFSGAVGALTNPYPSVINVGTDTTAINHTVENIQLILNSISSDDPVSLHMLLVAPGTGHALYFFGHAGSQSSSGTWTFSDTGGLVPFNGSIGTGTYAPTDFNTSESNPAGPSPTPAPPSGVPIAQPGGGANAKTFFQAFNGATANGDWLLYIYDNTGNVTNVSGGWCLSITPNTGTPTNTTVTSTQDPALSGTSVTITATVKNANNNTAITIGTVTFTQNGAQVAGGPATPVAVDANGHASFMTSSLPEGDNTITATYNDSSNTFSTSFGSIDERIDNTPTVSVNGTTVTYCNTGKVTWAAFPQNTGPAVPNPSNIVFSNLFGTLNTVSVTFKGFENTADDKLTSLLVGPAATTAQTLDFFSGTGGAYSPINITIADAGSSFAPTGANSLAATTYKPTSEPSLNQAYTSSMFYTLPGTFNKAAPAGTGTSFSNSFSGINPNAIGTQGWSLYLDLLNHNDNSGPQNGWCLSFLENPPALTATKGPSGLHVTQGQSAAITVVVHNPSGPGSAGGAIPVQVSDTFPTGLTPTGGSGTGWSCGTVSGTSITCTSTEFIASGHDFDTLTINFGAAANATVGTNNNTAVISGSGLTSPVSSNTLGITVDPAPVLAVSKSAVGTFTQGSTAEWDVTVTNTVANSSTNGLTTTVVDTLPTGYTVSSFGNTSASWTCGSATSNNITTVTCTSNQVVTGNSTFGSLQIIVNIPTTSPTSVTNNAKVWGGGDLTHPDSAHAATTSLPTTVVQVPASVTINGNGMTSESLSATVGMAFASLAVTVKDAGGAVIANTSNLVKFTAPATGPSGTFTGNANTITVSTNASGVADPGTFTANTSAGSYMVSVAVTSGTGSATFNLTNLAGTATQLSVTSGTPQNVTVGMAAGAALVATAADQYGNPVSGLSVTFTAPATGASGKFANSSASIIGTTGTNGQVSESYTANTAAGAYNVTASAGGTNSVNFMITNVAGTPTTVTATSGGGQTTNVNTQFTNPLVATVTDTYGNPVSGVDVTFTPVPNANGATCTLASAGGMARTPVSGRNGRGSRTGTLKPHDATSVDVMTGTNGIAETTCTANGTTGAYSVTAATGTATSASFGLTNNTGTVQVTVATNIMGPTVSVDGGTAFTGSQMFQWAPNSQHTISTTSPQTNGTTQYVWLNWSDSGAISHMVSGPSTATTFTANFKTQYQLTTNVNLAAGGTVSPATGFYDAGSNINITATPNSPQYAFYNFTGDLGTSSSTLPITLRGPLSETANFTGGVTSLGMSLAAKSGPTNARVWTIAIGNNGPGFAVGAEIANLTFAVQSGGGAGCAPVVSGLPAVVPGAPIGVRATGNATVTIDFSSCPTNTLFKMTTVLSANNGNAMSTVVKGSQLP